LCTVIKPPQPPSAQFLASLPKQGRESEPSQIKSRMEPQVKRKGKAPPPGGSMLRQGQEGSVSFLLFFLSLVLPTSWIQAHSSPPPSWVSRSEACSSPKVGEAVVEERHQMVHGEAVGHVTATTQHEGSQSSPQSCREDRRWTWPRFHSLFVITISSSGGMGTKWTNDSDWWPIGVSFKNTPVFCAMFFPWTAPSQHTVDFCWPFVQLLLH